jgi:hypothetical protein
MPTWLGAGMGNDSSARGGVSIAGAASATAKPTMDSEICPGVAAARSHAYPSIDTPGAFTSARSSATLT